VTLILSRTEVLDLLSLPDASTPWKLHTVCTRKGTPSAQVY
jgi:hypothetical protein